MSMTKFDCIDSYSIDISLEKKLSLHIFCVVQLLPVYFIAILIVEDETRHISPLAPVYITTHPSNQTCSRCNKRYCQGDWRPQSPSFHLLTATKNVLFHAGSNFPIQNPIV